MKTSIKISMTIILCLLFLGSAFKARGQERGSDNFLETLSKKYDLPMDAVECLYHGVQAGGGQQAQFNHPRLGGMGQWMLGNNMTMIGDMFNVALKTKVNQMATEMAQKISQPAQPATRKNPSSMPSMQPMSSFSSFAPMRPMAPMAPFKATFASATNENGPDMSGGQNGLQYRYYSAKGIVEIDYNGRTEKFKTTAHFTGVSQEQKNGRQVVKFRDGQGNEYLFSVND